MKTETNRLISTHYILVYQQDKIDLRMTLPATRTANYDTAPEEDWPAFLDWLLEQRASVETTMFDEVFVRAVNPIRQFETVDYFDQNGEWIEQQTFERQFKIQSRGTKKLKVELILQRSTYPFDALRDLEQRVLCSRPLDK